MDFFEHQDIAQRKTSLLISYYCLAVFGIIVAVYIAVSLVFGNGWDLGNFALTSLVTIVVVALGSLLKSSQLKQGGRAVAEMLGGNPVDPSSTSPHEKILLNVVQEMAIASGTPVPPVYLLGEEQCINAFAAGFNPGDAVIGVTRGCLERLGRDELQGVIAHEFSHILNGDMRLNIRLIGVLGGILSIALLGFGLMRAAAFTSHRSRRRNDGGTGLALIALGVALAAIGYIGVFFAKVIKSAVSRQREYLADAAAVQFTRNPAGLASALKQIGSDKGSRLQTNKAEEVSHLFFSSGVTSFLGSVMATHPPLAERISRIEPSADNIINYTSDEYERKQPDESVPTSFAVSPQSVVQSVGSPGPEHVAYAADILSRVPDRLLRASQDPMGAQALLYNLLLDHDTRVSRHQLGLLRRQADPEVFLETERLRSLVASCGPEFRLPVVELAFPALRSLSTSRYQAFRSCVQNLMDADRKISVFEYALQHMLLRHLEQAFGDHQPATPVVRSISRLRDACADLLSVLASVGHESESSAQKSFADGMAVLFPGDLHTILETSLPSLDRALDDISCAAPALKRKVVAACATCVVSDRQVTVEESELLRAVVDSLDCPTPPLQAINTER